MSKPHPAITGDQADRIRESATSLIASANEGMPVGRRVSYGTAVAIANRSMIENAELPFSIREHRAIRDVSDFITLTQHNKTNFPNPKNTDLLNVGHPRSTQFNLMDSYAFSQAKARWLASDPSIPDDEVRTLVASAYAALPGSIERKYYLTRIDSLPTGSLPKALVAAFGDGNSTAARSARARLQRRDRKGRFAWMGGGIRALIKRANGIFSFSGRFVGQGVGADDTFDMETPDGRLWRVPAQRAEALKATLRLTPDGFSPRSARVTAGDPVINESDLIEIQFPNGFRVDDDYSGPGERFTDDAYDVTKYTSGDPAAPDLPEGVTLKDNLPIYVVARRDGSKAGEIFSVSQSWADVQSAINKDEVNLDKEEGREADPIARLSDDEFTRLREQADATGRDPLEILREMQGEGAAPKPARRGTPDMADFEFETDSDSYVFDTTEEYVPRGPRRGNSADYTDEPELLNDMFDQDDLIDALRQGVLPDEDGNEATGRGGLDFGEGPEDVPVEAIFEALKLKGVDADLELARIYDENNSSGVSNEQRLNEFRGAGEAPVARLDEGEGTPAEEETPLEATMPALFEGLSREEQQRILDTGEWGQYLSENADVEMPEGYYTPDPENFDNVDGISEHDPLNNTREYTQEQLEAAYRESLEPSATPGYGTLTKTDPDGEETSVSVPAESLRDSLKMMNVDTDALTEQIASEGREGQTEPDDAEANRILEEEGGQMAWDFSEEEVSAAKEDADALGYEGVSDLIDEEPTLDEVIERIYAVGGDDLIQRIFGSRFEQDLADRKSAEFVEEPSEEQLERWTRMDRFLNFLERLGGGPGFIQSEFKPKDGSGDSRAQREKKARERAKEAKLPTLEEMIQKRKEEGFFPQGGLRMPEDEQRFIEDLERQKEEQDGVEPLTPAEQKAEEKVKDEVEQWRERNRERAERDRERLPQVLQRRIDAIDKELDALDPEDEDTWLELVAERIKYQDMLDDLTNPRAGARPRRARRPRAEGERAPRQPRAPRRPRSEGEGETPAPQPETPQAGEEVDKTPAPEGTPEQGGEEKADLGTPTADSDKPTTEEIVEKVTDAPEGDDADTDPKQRGERNTGDKFYPNPQDPNNVFNQEYVDWLLSPDRQWDQLHSSDLSNLDNILYQMTDEEWEARFEQEGSLRNRIMMGNELQMLISDAIFDPDRERYSGTQTEFASDANPAANDVVNVPESDTPDVQPYVAPDAEPAPEQESAPQRRRRLGRNRRKAAANGRDDAAPDVSFLDELRGGRQRLLRGAGDRLNAARDQLKKLYAGWEGRGRHMPRPEHVIISRDEDPNLVGDAEYKDRYGRIVRPGDVVAHRRVGDLINPDREAVNLIKGQVVDRGTIIRPNEDGVDTEYSGYLTVLVLESDDPEWVGQYFTYAAGETEIVRQPGLADEVANRVNTEDENAAQYLTRLSDEQLYTSYFYVAVGGGGGADKDRDLQLMAHEISARGLVNPQDLADLLTFVTDDALAQMPEDIGRNEGAQGRVFRELIRNERERRARGGRGDRPGVVTLPNLTDLFGQKAQGVAQRDLAPEPEVAPEAAPEPQAAPNAPNAPEGGAAEGNLPPLDERAVPERYVPSDLATVRPQGQAEGDPATRGIDNPNAGAIHPNAANPNAQQIDYADWDGQRAAEIAEAARSRHSVADLVQLVKDARNGDAEAGRKVIAALKNIYGVEDVRLGERGFTLQMGRPSFDFDERSQKLTTQVEMKLLDENGRIIGSVHRNLNFYLNEPDRSYAYNALFRIENDAARGGGVTDAYNRWMENWYVANGIKQVQVTAAGGGDWTGGAVWALNNFSFMNPRGEARQRLVDLETMIRRLRDADQREAATRDLERLRARVAEADAAGDSSMYPTPLHFALVGWRPGMKKDWVGYRMMASSGWSGVKSLDPNSVNQRERIGYNDIMRVARRRIDAGDNKFTPSADMRARLGDENSYADAENSVIAPFRDEIIPFMSGNGGSLAALSPAARHALSIWSARQLQNQGKTDPEEAAGLLFQLRDEVVAYDRANDSLGERGQILKRVTLRDLEDAYNSGGELKVNGQATGFTARMLSGDESGINETFMVTDTQTGQVYFIKQQSEAMTMQEIYGNVIGRALGARGAPYVDLADDRRLMITTFGGDGIANALYTERPADIYSWDEYEMYGDLQNRLSLADLASIGVLDAVISNGDRHMGNFLITNLGTYGVRGDEDGAEDVVPILIDHGHAQLNQWAGDPQDSILRGYPGDINAMLSGRMLEMAPEARWAIIQNVTRRAIDRLRAVQDPNMDQAATDIAIRRLEAIAAITAQEWANMERGY